MPLKFSLFMVIIFAVKVGIVDSQNNLMSVINITDVLGDRGFLHPHDAHFVPDDSGDFVLVTWNPGRIGYFRRLQDYDEAESLADN